MARKSQRNNVMAGSFLLLALGLGLAVSIILSGMTLKPHHSYVITFSVADGAIGLQPGSAVYVGGQPAGKVTRIDFAKEGGRATGIEVRVKLRADLTFYEDAVAYLEIPLLGTLSWINFPTTGGEGGGAQVAPGGRIRGQLAPPAFLAQAGYGPAEQARVGAIIEGIESAVQRVNRRLEDADPVVAQTLEDIQVSVAELRETVERLSGRVPDWEQTIDASLASVTSFTDRLPGIAEEVEGGVRDVRAGIGDARMVINDVGEAVDANRPAIDRTIANIEQATRAVNERTLPQLERTLATADREVQETGNLVDDFRALLDEQLPSIRRTFANLRLTSEQLKLVATEIRAQPWRLLIRPSTKELENQLLYDSARTYAQAVSDLRAASEALQAALARSGTGTPVDPETLGAIQAALDDAFARYQAAEREMLDRMIGH